MPISNSISALYNIIVKDQWSHARQGLHPAPYQYFCSCSVDLKYSGCGGVQIMSWKSGSIKVFSHRALIMTRNYITRTIFVSCMLVVIAGFAKADIVQCVDDTGTITYTDVPCQIGDDVAQTSALANSSAISPKVSSRADIFVTAGAARKATWGNKSAINRTLALDVVTLKAARSSMLLMDQASSLSRKQKLAAPVQRGQH